MREKVEAVIKTILDGHDERSKQYRITNEMLAYEILDGLYDAGIEVKC